MLIEHGIPIPKRGIRHSSNLAKALWIRDQKAAGKTYREIALELGVTRQAVQNYIRPTGALTTNSKCALCGRKNIRLHQHHTNYISGETVILCPACHKKEHREIMIAGFRERYKNRNGISQSNKSSSLPISDEHHSKISFAAAMLGKSVQECSEQAIDQWYDRYNNSKETL